ncbi:MAG: oxygen-dependent coproporphyrinogen oxidase [Acidobacteriota bacterium]
MRRGLSPMRERAETMVREAQETICRALEELDGGRFRADVWARDGGGGGVSRILQDGPVIEKAGVNTSVVWGELPEDAARALAGGHNHPVSGRSFFAAGISVIVHPRNPYAPTAHCNVRYFERAGGDDAGAWWFGGGADLTPCYLFDEDAAHFHRTMKAACDRHDAAFYPRFKRWCDEYFFLPHRGEARGVGGIFFDDLHDRPADRLLDFARDCALAFVPAYVPVIDRRKDTPYGEAERRWQELRRGRYVEFNLVYDRGTSFGLKTGGRTESVLVSLPPVVRWEYAVEVDDGSPEARLLEALRTPREWA